MSMVSCCGSDCAACTCLGTLCRGCSASLGNVFHAPQGQACPIYACCVNTHDYATCASCAKLPCDLWRQTRDPSLTDETFAQNIQSRAARLNRSADN